MFPIKTAEEVAAEIMAPDHGAKLPEEGQSYEPQPTEPQLNENELLLHYDLQNIIDIAQTIDRRRGIMGLQGGLIRERFYRDLDAHFASLSELSTEIRGLIRIIMGEHNSE